MAAVRRSSTRKASKKAPPRRAAPKAPPRAAAVKKPAARSGTAAPKKSAAPKAAKPARAATPKPVAPAAKPPAAKPAPAKIPPPKPVAAKPAAPAPKPAVRPVPAPAAPVSPKTASRPAPAPAPRPAVKSVAAPKSSAPTIIPIVAPKGRIAPVPPNPVAPPPAPPPPAPAPVPAPKPVPPPRRALVTLTLVTRKSPLAIAQSDLVLARFAERIPDYAFRVFKLVTTGDRQEEWSLEQQGGKGLFTGELEMALKDFRADVAVHSAKDLPTEMPVGLAISGYLPREDPRDLLIVRESVARPATIATGSPRRRQQLERQFAKSAFIEIRGNVETRLKKIADGYADATVLAAAGLKRLGILEYPGLRFQQLPLAVCVPAVGQAAIAVQARSETANFLRPHLDADTRRAVELERTFLRRLGGGCHVAFAIHYDGAAVHIYHESCGYQRFNLVPAEADEPERVAERLLAQLKLKP